MVSCRDCPSYLASAETVYDHLLPAETTVHEKWLSAEIVRHIWLPPRLFVISCFLSRLPSTKYGFLQRLSVISCLLRDYRPRKMAFCRDCPSYLASTETVRDLLLPAETTVHEIWLPAEIVRVFRHPAETLGRMQIHTTSLCRKLFPKHNSLGKKQEIADSLGGSKI